MMRKFILFAFLLINGLAFADDPGITKVRLIQESDSIYTLEIDISQQLLWTIKAPQFPGRFRVSEPDIEDQSGWITLKFNVTTTGAPLSYEDEIILPWARNGVDITVQWQDGKTFKGLFNRSLDGIHIPMKELMEVRKSTIEVVTEGFQLGIRHLLFSFTHLLLILVLVWASPKSKILRYLIAMTLGQMAAMLLVELRIPGFDLLLSDLLLLLLILMLSFTVAYRKKFRYLSLLLFLCGLLHALSYVSEINVLGLSPLQKIQSLFAFNFAMDLGHYVFALCGIWVLTPLRQKKADTKWIPVTAGAFSIFLILLFFGKNVFANNIRILDLEKPPTATNYKTAVPPGPIANRQTQRGTGLMTTPLMVFLSVEPFEIREEILIQPASVLQYTSLNGENLNTIAVDVQEQLKKEIEAMVTSSNSMQANAQPLAAIDTITNFVTLGRGGVAIRQGAVEEPMDEAIVGITLVYEMESFPDSVSVDWQMFPEDVGSIEASTVDPHGTFTAMLTPEQNNIFWQSRLKGYTVPAIEPIEIERTPRPLLSYLIWACVLLVLGYRLYYKRTADLPHWMVLTLLLSFIAYPFLRSPLNLPFIPQGQPSEEKANIILTDLLTNVYRAFDRRNENDVYDRLALSVTQNQLTDIYIQNRQSMALENRGGARANVEEVNIQQLHNVEPAENSGYVADTQWTVRGSVNHFGHTHYRQNQYRALVTFDVDNEYWKINNIEILDSKRLY